MRESPSDVRALIDGDGVVSVTNYDPHGLSDSRNRRIGVERIIAEISEKIGGAPQNILPATGARVPLGERVGEAWDFGANGHRIETSGFALGGCRIPPKLGPERRDPLDKLRTLAGEMQRDITAHAVAEERRRSDLVAVKQLDHVLGEVLRPKGTIARRSGGVSLKVELVNAKVRS